ncbi:MAG: substrate-binding domain-containing protein [Ilumatobacteraceae bacterium]|nr:substrate-binding domain-containing protein [Ilumatobacteraceae bacterium]
MAQRQHQLTRRLVLAVAAFSMIAAACGDDESSSDTTQAPSETTVAGSDTTAAAGNNIAAERVAAFLKPTTELPLNAPLKVEAGKKLYYVQCSVPVCAEIAVGIEAAAEAAGWEYETTSHQDTPETVASAFDAAIAAKPDVVLTSGNPREWFASQLAALQEQKIPIVAWSMPEAYEPGDGVSVNLLTEDDYYFYGVLMADYAALNSPNKNILFVGLPTFPVLSTVQQGFEDEIAVVCPECKVDVTEVAVTDLGTNLPGTVVSKLQANPDLDHIVYAFGGMLFGVPEAIEAAGLGDQATAISQAGGPLNFSFIKAGQHQVAEVGLASELMGWRAVDAAARILAGEGPGRAETPALAVIDGHPDILSGGLPLQILEADSIVDPTTLWPGVTGFQDLFTALWAG